MSETSPIRTSIVQKLTESLAPQRLEVVDDSEKHRGHAGHDPRGESHFRVLIISDKFEKKPRIERHRMIYTALQKEITDRIHALQILAISPSEIKKDTISAQPE